MNFLLPPQTPCFWAFRAVLLHKILVGHNTKHNKFVVFYIYLYQGYTIGLTSLNQLSEMYEASF